MLLEDPVLLSFLLVWGYARMIWGRTISVPSPFPCPPPPPPLAVEACRPELDAMRFRQAPTSCVMPRLYFTSSSRCLSARVHPSWILRDLWQLRWETQTHAA